MIWPAVGISTAIFYFAGPRAFVWILLGHTILWWRPGLTLASVFLPLIHALEALLAWHLAFDLPAKWRRDRGSINLTLWQMLVVPWLAALPCAALVAGLALSEGRLPSGSFGMAISQLALSHVHGLVVFTPALAHLLKRDFQLLSPDDHRLGFMALLAAFVVAALAFLGFFRDSMGMSSAAYLAFPFLMVAAVSVRPPVIASALVIWCLGTTGLTGLGRGPFAAPLQSNPLELGVYNLVICYTTYLISAGSTLLLHQLRRNELIMEAAGVELWEWDSRVGLRGGIRKDDELSQAEAQVQGMGPASALIRLSGDGAGDLHSIPERWKQRLDGSASSTRLLMSAGNVLSRARDGSPQEVIGMLQDLSPLRRAEEALIELGQKQAVVESLQTRLNPHFLFNALNAIRALIHIDQVQASEAVTVLARLLRANLRNLDRPLIPVDEELDSIHHLLEISKVRFGDRLSTTIAVKQEAMDVLVPPMIIFNLVENALIHGVEKTSGPAALSIRGGLIDHQLVVEITNPGVLGPSRQAGIGIKDLRQRLDLFYGTAASFELVQAEENLVCATLKLPLHEPAHSR